MCGIAGLWGDSDQECVQEMMDRLAHRGPDAEGHFLCPDGNGVLGHRRLSIMDPLGGNQPILHNTGSAIAANGEIYNFAALRRTLQPAPKFRTQSDTEVILHLYHELDRGMVSKLDGMYAFVIADGEHVFAARDPIGIKPLYVGQRDGSWCFASELKALVGIAEDVVEFPPGTAYHSAHGSRTFYHVPADKPDPLSPDSTVHKLRRTLEEAVCKRLMSDVPLGAFLSGGLDSSVIAAIARRHMDELHTFAVGTEGSPDLEAARVVARHLDTIHHEYILTQGEVLRRLPEILYHLESYDQDLVRSAVPCYFTARLAAEHVKVVLTGEGADELFAGYRYYRDIADAGALHRELGRSVASLHNINLQRVDRMTMAHGIEGRVPFLDLAMIDLALKIPTEMKLGDGPRGRRPEKWVLRKACEDLLPAEIVWRKKEQFDEGSGMAEVLSQHCRDLWKRRSGGKCDVPREEMKLRSDEEAAYCTMLCEAFSDPQPVLTNVARWSDRS